MIDLSLIFRKQTFQESQQTLAFIGKILFYFFFNLFSGRILDYSFWFMKMPSTAVPSSFVGLANDALINHKNEPN